MRKILRIGYDNICPVSHKPCDHETCSPFAECKMSDKQSLQDTSSLPKQEGEKKQDWEHLLEMCIYTSLLGYSDEKGYSIPCKVREDMKRHTIDRFKFELLKRGFSVTQKPSPKQEPYGPVCSTEIREPSQVVNFLESELSAANAQIEALQKAHEELKQDAAFRLDAIYARNKEIEALKEELSQARVKIQEQTDWIYSHC